MPPLRHDVETSPRRHVAMLERRDVGTSLRRHVATFLRVFDLNVMSSHFTSHHVMSRLITTTKRRDVLGSDEQNRNVVRQRRDIGHERRNVAGFSNDGKVAKIQSLGLLPTSKLFLFHINHPRSSYDLIHKEQHWI